MNIGLSLPIPIDRSAFALEWQAVESDVRWAVTIRELEEYIKKNVGDQLRLQAYATKHWDKVGIVIL